MNNNLTKAKCILNTEKCTCVLCNDNITYKSTQRGIKPLLDLLDKKTTLKGFSAADKVIGNAAAYIYVLMEIQNIYAAVISEAALNTLKKHCIDVQYDTLVKTIINRKGNGRCPMECAVENCTEPSEALTAIRKCLQRLTDESKQ